MCFDFGQKFLGYQALQFGMLPDRLRPALGWDFQRRIPYRVGGLGISCFPEWLRDDMEQATIILFECVTFTVKLSQLSNCGRKGKRKRNEIKGNENRFYYRYTFINQSIRFFGAKGRESSARNGCVELSVFIELKL